MDEQYFEKLMNIHTAGEQKILNDSFQYNIYEPTSYDALKTLADNYEFKSSDSVVDFGCGKGRLNFFLHRHCGCSVTGIEMNRYYYDICRSNLETYQPSKKYSSENIKFLCILGQQYEISDADNKFYFFNPFSVNIFIPILNNITNSYYDNPRTMDIILFYPSEDFIDYLNSYSIFSLYKEIPLEDKYSYDVNQRFLIYRAEPFC